ncbi:hypothetical protein V8G54_027584, partial [Vigna mungo]
AAIKVSLRSQDKFPKKEERERERVKQNNVRLRSNRNGVFLFSCGSEEEGAAEQAGGGDVLAVRRRSQRGGYDDTNQILLHSILLQILESYYLHFLWSHSQILQMSTTLIFSFVNVSQYM